jgi:SHS2 domain-containing protein
VSARGGYEFVEGATSDLSFVARGASPEATLAAAAEALLAATVEDPRSVREEETHHIRLEEPSLDLLLLRFLNELVYLRDAEELLLRPRAIRLSRDGVVRLEAEMAGERLRRERHALESEVKAATAHGLALRETEDGWEARVTLDV